MRTGVRNGPQQLKLANYNSHLANVVRYIIRKLFIRISPTGEMRNVNV